MPEFSHIDAQGRARMVDVSAKPLSERTASARGHISLQPETIEKIRAHAIAKGNVLTVAELAGVQGAKHTPALIPLCHTLLLSSVQVQASLTDSGVTIVSDVRSTGQTGVEMEALTATSIALLTVYDMCKAVDKDMVMGPIELLQKTKTPAAT